MASKKPKIEPGTYYHIYNRGNNRQKIFLEEQNYDFFLRKLPGSFDPAGVETIAYCLMPNHFHLLVTPQNLIDFGKTMRAFSNSYVRSFNNQYRRTGHLYEGDYQPRCIDTDEYLTHLLRYIHLNPVKAGLVDNPENWKYSDYTDWISTTDSKSIKTTLRDNLFGSAQGYRSFVMDYESELRMENKLEKYLFG
ncbi:MAG: transposase [Ignavibacteriales bacterium]|nr:transposase [Ignavibacteriales bacterium]